MVVFANITSFTLRRKIRQLKTNILMKKSEKHMHSE